MANRFIKFGIVGVSGAIVFFSILALLVEFFGLDKHLAWLIAAIFSILNNFIWNNIYTWPDRKTKSKKETASRLGLYYFFTFLAAGVNYLIYSPLLKIDVHYLLSAAVAALVAAIFSFSFSHFIVFK